MGFLDEKIVLTEFKEKRYKYLNLMKRLERIEKFRKTNFEYFEGLYHSMLYGKISMQEGQEKILMKREDIIQEHLKKHRISKGKGNDKRWHTRLPDGSDNGKGRRIKAQTREALEKKIIEFYSEQPQTGGTGRNIITIRKLYPSFLEQKRLENIRDTSIHRYMNTWNKYLENDTTLVDADLKKLTRAEYKDWTLKFLKANPMKRKCYNDVRTVLMMIVDIAADRGYIPDNYFRNVTIPRNCFLEEQENTEEQVFTDEEIRALVLCLWNKFRKNPSRTVPLAVLFQIQTGLRVGELEAIHFSDIDSDGFLHVKRQFVRTENAEGRLIQDCFIDRAKSNSRKKPIYLSEEARSILELVKRVNIDNGDTADDLIFYNDHKPLTTSVFNGCLITACHNTNISPRRSHKVRKTFGTMLANSGVNVTAITTAMGHSSPEVTYRHYIKDMNTRAETAKAIESALETVPHVPLS